MQLDQPFLAVTPTIDGAVLAALARADAAFSVSQLQRVIGRYSIVGIRKVLARLDQQGIVIAVATANSLSYRLNRQHLVAEAVIAIAETKSRFFQRLQDEMAAWPAEVRYGAVFGSAVRGEMRPGSDVDLLVIHDDNHDHTLWDHLATSLELSAGSWTGNRLSLLAMPVSELEERRQDSLIRDIAGSSLTVRGTRSWFERAMRGGGFHAHA